MEGENEMDGRKWIKAADWNDGVERKQVKKLINFEAEHPEIKIEPGGKLSLFLVKFKSSFITNIFFLNPYIF